ncbi:MAG: S41 family peptidase [Patescibacteria group bacterium]|nr:S41 family peptidase [Patescibacteria group bacterium]
MKIGKFQLIAIVIVSALLGYYIGVTKISLDWKNYKPTISFVNKEPPVALKTADFSMFWNVWQSIEKTYYDKTKLDPQKMLNGAISGMVESLEDPYTVFLPPVQNSDFKQSLAGQFEGIGAELGMQGKQIIIVAPLDGMPAKMAGIKAGDAILKVDGQATSGWTLTQAVDKIRGPKGSEVILEILHKDSNKPLTVKVVRGTITVKSVDGWIKAVKDIERIKITDKKEDKIMYIRLSQFGDNTNQEWLTLVNSLSLSSRQGKDVRGLIIDLRNNPGGYLNDATFITSEFIEDGTVVIQEKGNGEKTDYPVSRKGLFLDIPIMVLINKGSASASEIVAGALRDHDRAKLVGETSFGKGTIQQAEELGNGAGLHVTVAKWLTPKGIWVHQKGLEPDFKVNLDSNDQSRDTQLEKAIQELIK